MVLDGLPTKLIISDKLTPKLIVKDPDRNNI